MIPNATQATGARAAITLIIERAMKRHRRPGPATLTAHEQEQRNRLEGVIYHHNRRTEMPERVFQSAREIASRLKIQL